MTTKLLRGLGYGGYPYIEEPPDFPGYLYVKGGFVIDAQGKCFFPCGDISQVEEALAKHPLRVNGTHYLGQMSAALDNPGHLARVSIQATPWLLAAIIARAPLHTRMHDFVEIVHGNKTVIWTYRNDTVWDMHGFAKDSTITFNLGEGRSPYSGVKGAQDHLPSLEVHEWLPLPPKPAGSPAVKEQEDGQ